RVVLRDRADVARTVAAYVRKEVNVRDLRAVNLPAHSRLVQKIEQRRLRELRPTRRQAVDRPAERRPCVHALLWPPDDGRGAAEGEATLSFCQTNRACFTRGQAGWPPGPPPGPSQLPGRRRRGGYRSPGRPSTRRM